VIRARRLRPVWSGRPAVWRGCARYA